MTQGFRQLLLVSTLAVSTIALSGCVALTIAGIATNVLSSAIGGGAGAPEGATAPGAQIQQALSRLDDQVSPSCTARLAGLRVEQDGSRGAGDGARAAGVWGESDWRFESLDRSPKPADMPLSAPRPLPREFSGPPAPAPSSPPSVTSDAPSGATPGAFQTAAARQESVSGKRCSVRPACLPGMAAPVSMMVCEGNDQGGPAEVPQGVRAPLGAQRAAGAR